MFTTKSSPLILFGMVLYTVSDGSAEFDTRIQRGENLAVAFGAPEADEVRYISPDKGKPSSQAHYYRAGRPGDFSYTFMDKELRRVVEVSTFTRRKEHGVSSLQVFLYDAEIPVYRQPCHLFLDDKAPLAATPDIGRLAGAPTRARAVVLDEAATQSRVRSSSHRVGKDTLGSTRALHTILPPAASLPSMSGRTGLGLSMKPDINAGKRGPPADSFATSISSFKRPRPQLRDSRFKPAGSSRASLLRTPLSTTMKPLSAVVAPTHQHSGIPTPPATPVLPEHVGLPSPQLPSYSNARELTLDSPSINGMVQQLQHLCSFTESALAEHRIPLPKPCNAWDMVRILSERLQTARQELEVDRQALENERRTHEETRAQLQSAQGLLDEAVSLSEILSGDIRRILGPAKASLD